MSGMKMLLMFDKVVKIGNFAFKTCILPQKRTSCREEGSLIYSWYRTYMYDRNCIFKKRSLNVEQKTLQRDHHPTKPNLCAANRITSMVSRRRAAARRHASQLVSQIRYLGGIVEKKQTGQLAFKTFLNYPARLRKGKVSNTILRIFL